MDPEYLLIDQYLALMDQQRTDIFRLLIDLDNSVLWKRPAEDKWSIGEHIDHCRILTRSFRRIFNATWVVTSPIARIWQNRPYQSAIDDVYDRPGFPLNVGWIWPPHYNSTRQITLIELQTIMEQEHHAVRKFYEQKDERLLGHIKLYDPVIGWLNLIQTLRVGIYHDAHHFRAIKQTLS